MDGGEQMTHQHNTRQMLEQWEQVDPTLRTLLAPIHNDQQYQEALGVFETLMEVVEAGADPSTLELFSLIGENIQRYEQEHHAIPHSAPEDVLRFLMEQHGLTQAELPEIGSQGVVSEVLSGKRKLNVRQIQALSDRFRVVPTLFLTAGAV
jgi:HTH-type transcriptional regulator / antitoxin HigA